MVEILIFLAAMLAGAAFLLTLSRFLKGPTAADRVVADVWGVGVDLKWQVSDRFGVMGEFYTGEALGTYNGGILQNLFFLGQSFFWKEFVIKPKSSKLLFNLKDSQFESFAERQG